MALGEAHGKIILMGEHAVVYGYKAIALPLLAAKVVVKCSESAIMALKSDYYTGPVSEAPKTLNPIVSLILALEAEHSLKPLTFTLDSNLYAEAGLGSSAAVASAIVEAVYKYIDKPLSQETRFKWVQYSETLAHTNPSGIDAQITMSDHAIIYARNQPIKPLIINLDATLVIGYTGVKGQTKKAVEHIAKTINEPTQNALMKALGHTTTEGLNALNTHNINDLGQAMDKAHTILRQLGVSHQELERFVTHAKNHKAIGAKLTGGGLGGCAIALFEKDKDADAFYQYWQKTVKQPVWKLKLSR